MPGGSGGGRCSFNSARCGGGVDFLRRHLRLAHRPILAATANPAAAATAAATAAAAGGAAPAAAAARRAMAVGRPLGADRIARVMACRL
eukprot:362866-Chlamydomonas_euryale.AAC.14